MDYTPQASVKTLLMCGNHLMPGMVEKVHLYFKNSNKVCRMTTSDGK